MRVYSQYPSVNGFTVTAIRNNARGTITGSVFSIIVVVAWGDPMEEGLDYNTKLLRLIMDWYCKPTNSRLAWTYIEANLNTANMVFEENEADNTVIARRLYRTTRPREWVKFKEIYPAKVENPTNVTE